MKKNTFLIAFILMALTASSQIKVAILEPVDKGQNVTYGSKLLLRSSLTQAISNTPGYEGYDRVDMASIADEQEFQRTGNVSDSQIKQLGVATGAAYVLVAEAAKYDATNIIITAKILDVETFGVASSTVKVSGISAYEMQQSCIELAEKLLNPVKTASVAPVTTAQVETNLTNTVTTNDDWRQTIPTDTTGKEKKTKKKFWKWILIGVGVGVVVGLLSSIGGSSESYDYSYSY